MEFSERLIKEHEPIRRAMNVLTGMVHDAEHDVAIDKHDINALLLFLHYFGDTFHQAKEEEILIPILKRSKESTHVQKAQEHSQDALTEHNEQRTLIEKAQLALFSDQPSEFTAGARKLIQRLSEHILMEEAALFPAAEKVLTQEEAQEVVMRMEEADADFGRSQRALLIELLDELEAKYLRKAA